MTRTNFRHAARWIALAACVCLFCISISAQAPAAPANRFVGTITAINGDTLTVKTDAGEVKQVAVPSTAALKRVAPGQKDLSAAVSIELTDLATGDRVLVRLDASTDGNPPAATQIVTIKAEDVAHKQQQEREEWQRNGVGGLVKSIDAAHGTLVLTSGAGATAKTITIHVTPATVLKRYAPASVRFDQATVAPIDAIQPGDQLRARGTKNDDGTDVNAAEIVSGSFKNLSGVIASLDAAASSFTVKDLATKKTLTVHITPDAQMHALPDMMARALAARLKGTAPANGGASGGAVQAGARPAGNWQGGNAPASGQWGPAAGRFGGQNRGNSDLQQMLNRAPVIQFSDLKKGDAVMVVATAGAADVTAITLLTGVEPLLEAPEASRNLLSNWSMGSGGAGESESQ